MTSPVGKCSLEVEDQDDGECFYLDDFTVEYIPEGLDDNSDITKNLALVSEAENVEMSNAGVINLMDAADSAITVEDVVSKLDVAVTTIDANGAAVSGSALASGSYAVLDREIWPDICYMASDLNVTAEDGEVCAYMPYSKDKTSAVIVAIYDDDDRLIASDIDTSDDGVLSVSLPSEGGHSYKVFLWNSIDSMNPYYGNAQGNIL